MNHCVTCKNWDPTNSHDRDAGQSTGACRAIRDEKFMPAPIQSAAVWGAYEDGGTIFTTAYFGCLAWEVTP